MGKAPKYKDQIDSRHFFLADARKKFWNDILNRKSCFTQGLALPKRISSMGLLLVLGVILLTNCGEATQTPNHQEDTIIEAKEPLKDVEGKIKDGLDIPSGLIAEGDYLIVKAHCTACHSGKLVTQNRATREGWESMIRWMQKTQKLWELGDHEDKILDYLAKHYAPENVGRRKTLVVDEWYEIEEE